MQDILTTMQFIKSMLSDSDGNTSSTRVVFLLVSLAVLVPAVYSALKTGTPLALSATDLQLLGGAGAVKLFQNSQENTPTPKL